MSLLSISEVVVAYGDLQVLKGVSLDVATGEFVALLGSSGCGKTTLLRAISGFIPTKSGRMTIDAREITHLPPDRRNMAMVFQTYALWPHMTAGQNIAYGLRLRRWSKAKIESRVQEILSLLSLNGLSDRPVTQLSGGQRQRIALGRALAISPQILLLDEPLSNLDAQIRLQLRHEIRAIQKKLNITAIHVTHDREEAMVMADRIVIMDAGTIVQIGTPEQVYNFPTSPFVAAFMGAENVIRLKARPAANSLTIDAGPNNSSATLSLRDGGCHAVGTIKGTVIAHFRSAAATLTDPSAPAHDALILQGKIVQASYPGGFFRYAVAVGAQTYMVDDERRLNINEPVGVYLKASALHLYASTH